MLTAKINQMTLDREYKWLRTGENRYINTGSGGVRLLKFDTLFDLWVLRTNERGDYDEVIEPAYLQAVLDSLNFFTYYEMPKYSGNQSEYNKQMGRGE